MYLGTRFVDRFAFGNQGNHGKVLDSLSKNLKNEITLEIKYLGTFSAHISLVNNQNLEFLVYFICLM